MTVVSAGAGPAVTRPIELHNTCFRDFRSLGGKMFVSYDAFISPLDRTDDNGELVTFFAQVLRNDRADLFRGNGPESEHDAFDDYFSGDERELAVFDDMVLIPDCETVHETTTYGLRLIERLYGGEKLRLPIRLFHLDNGRTGVLLRHPQ